MGARLQILGSVAVLGISTTLPVAAQTTQTAPFGADSAAQVPLKINSDTAASIQRPQGSQFNFEPNRASGPAEGVGQALQDWGINFRFPITEQFMNNATEGSNPGRTGSGDWILPTLDFDLHTMFGIPDARIRVMETMYFLKLHDDGDSTGFQAASDSGPLGTQHRLTKEPNTLSQLSYEQLLFDKRLDLEIGRMSIKRYFFTANCDVNQLTCLALLLNRNAGLPPVAYPTWMGRAEYNITPSLYIQGGINEIDPHANSSRGYDFGTNHASGYISAAEIGYKTSFATTPYPEEWELGGWYNTSRHPDALNSKITYDNKSLVLQGSKTVWRQDGGASNDATVRHVNTYFAANESLDKSNVYQSALVAGASLYAPIEDRPNDIVGFKVTWLPLSSHERQFLQQQRVAAGGVAEFDHLSWYLEANAHIQVARDLIAEPVVQYVIDPDTLFNAKVPFAHSGWVVGLTMIIDPAKMLGLGG
jgi:porin